MPGWRLNPDHYVLYLGRFSPEKNCHLLIDAFEALNTRMKLVLAGGSSYSDSYASRLRCHQSERVVFLPWLSGSDLEELLSNAALFVLPSDIEGLSLALLDAMGAGVCALTSDIPENKEVVAGVGFTFRHGDRLDLERMLDFLLRNPDLRREAGAKGQRRIQDEYLWPGIARSIEAVYYDVLGWKHRESALAEGSPKALPRYKPLDIADVSLWDSWRRKRRERVAGRFRDLEVVTANAPSVDSATPGCEARHDIASGFD